MEKQRKNGIIWYLILAVLLIIFVIFLLLIIKPFDNSSKYISIDNMIQKSDQCSPDINYSASSTETINYKQLKSNSNSESYSRRLVKITGYVRQVLDLNGKWTILLQIPKENIFSPDDVISIYYVGQTDVAENDMITVYGFTRGAFISEKNNQIIRPNMTSCKIVASEDATTSAMEE
jgi:hypothetical protein